MDKALIASGLLTVALALGFYFLLPLYHGPDPITLEDRDYTLSDYRNFCSDPIRYALAEDSCQNTHTYYSIIVAATGLGSAMTLAGLLRKE